MKYDPQAPDDYTNMQTLDAKVDPHNVILSIGFYKEIMELLAAESHNIRNQNTRNVMAKRMRNRMAKILAG